MTNKHFGWHKAWHRDGQRLVHSSGAEFIIERGEGFTDFKIAPESLAVFQASELERGVPLHDLAKRLMRLAREASEWHERNPEKNGGTQ